MNVGILLATNVYRLGPVGLLDPSVASPGTGQYLASLSQDDITKHVSLQF